jgi:hypothetical protein
MHDEKFDLITYDFQSLVQKLEKTTTPMERKSLLSQMRATIERLDRLTSAQESK